MARRVVVFFLLILSVVANLSAQTPASQSTLIDLSRIERRRHQGFWQLRRDDNVIFLSVRNQIKKDYLSPCSVVMWEGDPEPYFGKLSDAIRAARPDEMVQQPMRAGLLIRGDLNRCARENWALQGAVMGFCEGKPVEETLPPPRPNASIDVSLQPNLTIPLHQLESTKQKRPLREKEKGFLGKIWNKMIWSKVIRSGISRKADPLIKFYELCMPRQSDPSQGCGDSPEYAGLVSERSPSDLLAGLELMDGGGDWGVGIPDGSLNVGPSSPTGLENSPAGGPEAHVGDSTGEVSQRGRECQGGECGAMREAREEASELIDGEAFYNTIRSACHESGAADCSDAAINEAYDLAHIAAENALVGGCPGNFLACVDQSGEMFINEATLPADMNSLADSYAHEMLHVIMHELDITSNYGSYSSMGIDLYDARIGFEHHIMDIAWDRHCGGDSTEGCPGRAPHPVFETLIIRSKIPREMPMCDFYSSESCGGEYTFTFPMPNYVAQVFGRHLPSKGPAGERLPDCRGDDIERCNQGRPQGMIGTPMRADGRITNPIIRLINPAGVEPINPAGGVPSCQDLPFLTPWEWYTDNCEGSAGIACESSAGLTNVIARLTQNSRRGAIRHEMHPARMNRSINRSPRSRSIIRREVPQND